MNNLVWVRSDLRIYDNPALFNAMSKGPTVAVYCLTDKQWDKHGLSQIKRRLIVDHLFELEEQLSKLVISDEENVIKTRSKNKKILRKI